MNANPIPFDPMDGCPHCEWLETNLGRVLDRKCDLHQKIEDMQADALLTRQVWQSTRDTLVEVSKVIGAFDDDDPVRVAQSRMEEIEALEAELDDLNNEAPFP